MLLHITTTTDGKYIGEQIETDLISLILPSGESITFDGRIHLGEGQWKLWNSNYIIEAEEIINE